MLSPKQAAQPNPSCPALCCQDTTSPWSTDYRGNICSQTLILMLAMHGNAYFLKTRKKETFSRKKRNENRESEVTFQAGHSQRPHPVHRGPKIKLSQKKTVFLRFFAGFWRLVGRLEKQKIEEKKERKMKKQILKGKIKKNEKMRK